MSQRQESGREAYRQNPWLLDKEEHESEGRSGICGPRFAVVRVRAARGCRCEFQTRILGVTQGLGFRSASSQYSVSSWLKYSKKHAAGWAVRNTPEA